MTSIGCRCRGGNVYSRAILITQTLSWPQGHQNIEAVPPADLDSKNAIQASGALQVSKKARTGFSFRALFTLYSTPLGVTETELRWQ